MISHHTSGGVLVYNLDVSIQFLFRKKTLITLITFWADVDEDHSHQRQGFVVLAQGFKDSRWRLFLRCSSMYWKKCCQKTYLQTMIFLDLWSRRTWYKGLTLYLTRTEGTLKMSWAGIACIVLDMRKIICNIIDTCHLDTREAMHWIGLVWGWPARHTGPQSYIPYIHTYIHTYLNHTCHIGRPTLEYEKSWR